MKCSMGNSTIEVMRLFFAVRLGRELIEPVCEIQRKLRGDWRKTKPEQFHLTLAFLPQVLPSEVPVVEKAGELAAAICDPFLIELGTTGCFPNVHRPRVFVVHTQSSVLQEVGKALRNGLQGVDYDDKPFRGHLTLARANSAAVKVFEESVGLSWTADQLELVHSTLTGKEALHKVIRTFPFCKKK